MSKKGENIFKRRDGRWEARYEKGRLPSGKIQYGYCYGKKYKDAKQKVEEAKLALMTGRQTCSAAAGTFGSYCSEWLGMQSERLKQSTVVKYTVIVERHIRPQLGETRIDKLCRETFVGFKKMLLEKELSAKMIRDILTVVKAILKYTGSCVPGFSSDFGIVLPRLERSETRVLTLIEQQRFIEFLKHDLDPCKFGILLSLMTGIRIGEICALKWDAISLEESMLTIRSTMQRLRKQDQNDEAKTEIVIGHPKSPAAMRRIPLSKEALELANRMKPDSQSAYVLTGTNKFMEPRTMQNRMSKYANECGLDDVHFHTLRHTFATRCVEAGFEIKSLSEILGHANVNITLDRYVHSSMQLKRENMEKLSVFGF